jgi:hypothetical protein
MNLRVSEAVSKLVFKKFSLQFFEPNQLIMISVRENGRKKAAG